MRATISYTLLRLVLFVAAFGLLYAAGVGGILLLVLAALISGVISYFALYRQRTAMAGSVSRRVSGFRQRLDSATRAEDDD